MTTITETTEDLKAAVEERRQDLAQAQARVRAHAEEMAALPEKVREALGEAAAQRADAARRGEGTAHVAADLDLEDLQERQRKLPLELWASRIAATEAEISFYAAEDRMRAEEQREASARFERLKPEYEEMKAKYEHARAEASRDLLGAHQTDLRREAKRRLRELEGGYPGA